VEAGYIFDSCRACEKHRSRFFIDGFQVVASVRAFTRLLSSSSIVFMQQYVIDCVMKPFLLLSGRAGQKMVYLETSRAFEIANAIFGPVGWSVEIISSKMDFVSSSSLRWR
jgi:hypothetical protein